MTDANLVALRALLAAYAERVQKAQPASGEPEGEVRQRRACGDSLRTVVRPVLDAVQAELVQAGHEASTRDHSEKDNAYPSVALSFTPRAPGRGMTLASALIFRCDPHHGIVVQADVKPAPTRRVTAASSERLGTIGLDAASAAWVETKVLNFIHAVLKVN